MAISRLPVGGGFLFMTRFFFIAESVAVDN
jgi:hypothetical protein